MIDIDNKIIEKVAISSGLDKEEVERKVEAKRAKLSGLISREGALQVIAAELGVNFDNEKFKIGELLSGMRKVHTSGKIIRLFPIRNFTSKTGQDGKVLNFILADDTGNIRVVLWDTKHIELIENGNILEGDSVEIQNGNMREGEIHLGSFSNFKKSEEKFKDVSLEKKSSLKNIVNFNVNDSVSVRAFIVQSFDPRFFNVCPECKKKISQEGESFLCESHGKVTPQKRALINIIVDDGTESIRTVLFHDMLNTIGIDAYEDLELLSMQKNNILGQEFIFSGDIRMNKFFNNPEFIVNKIEKVDLDKLLSELEKK
jgi:replication factor A1